MQYQVTATVVATKTYRFNVDAQSEEEAEQIAFQDYEADDGELLEDYEDETIDVQEVTD